MNNINSYPSIYNLGHKAIIDLFKQPVIVEEKIDGSQFSFMKDESGTLHFRSKGAVVFAEQADHMFNRAVKAVQDIDQAMGIPKGLIFRGEYLSKPKHNTLAYDRTPTQFIIIFDIDDGNQNFLSPLEKSQLAQTLGFEVVPVLAAGMITDPAQLRTLLDTTSVLGGQKIEGVVIKPENYDLFGRDHHVLMGKFVSEAFKEVHQKEWKNNKTPGTNDIINILTACYGTEPRWNKAIEHLRDAGKLQDAPQDIGPLMAEVPADVQKECEDEIKDKLWKWAWPQLRRTLTRGLPEWYKQKLMDKQFESERSLPDADVGGNSVKQQNETEVTTDSQKSAVPVLAEPPENSRAVLARREVSTSAAGGEARESTGADASQTERDSRGGTQDIS